MPRHVSWLASGFAIAITTAALAFVPVVAGTPRVVNVTTDSNPGWTPSEEMEQQARTAANAFLAAMDGVRYDVAYAFLSGLNRKDQSLSDFTDRVAKFNALAGRVIERKIVTVAWTKDSANAPLPGTYVALDLVSRFANVDRHCGFLVLYQPPLGGDFKVMREEDNYMDNATAAGLAKKSLAAVDEAWA